MHINFQQIGFVDQLQYGAYHQNLRNNHICLPALIPSTPLLCETRWTAKYKSIRLFRQNFIDIHTSLHHLSQNGSSQQCRTHATQLYHSSNNSNFIICLIIIARYSSMLEPVTQMLQAVEMDIIKVQKHISNLIHQFTNHRDSCDDTFKTLYSKIQEHTEYLPAIRHAFNILLTLPATTCTVERSFSTLRREKNGYGLQCPLKDSVHYAC